MEGEKRLSHIEGGDTNEEGEEQGKFKDIWQKLFKVYEFFDKMFCPASVINNLEFFTHATVV